MSKQPTRKRLSNPKPHWNRELRELSYDGTLVKKFRRLAPMVERILDAFQEEGWPPRIDDPLPPIDSRKESDRLRNQIADLNRRLDVRLIRFYLDGTGTGICWQPVEEQA